MAISGISYGLASLLPIAKIRELDARGKSHVMMRPPAAQLCGPNGYQNDAWGGATTQEHVLGRSRTLGALIRGPVWPCGLARSASRCTIREEDQDDFLEGPRELEVTLGSSWPQEEELTAQGSLFLASNAKMKTKIILWAIGLKYG